MNFLISNYFSAYYENATKDDFTRTAPLTQRLLMIPLEAPFYFLSAYTTRFSNEAIESNALNSLFQVISKTYTLTKELLGELYIDSSSYQIQFSKNLKKIEIDFQKIRDGLTKSIKPICVFFVSAYDHNGGLLGNASYYHHLYKIQNYEKDYTVIPFLIYSASEMFQHLQSVKSKFSQDQVQLVDINVHGSEDSLEFPDSLEEDEIWDIDNSDSFDTSSVEEDQFKDIAQNATIILSSCSTGKGEESIAEKIALMNPGKTVFAPKCSLFFSKPIIEIKNGNPRVKNVVHGVFHGIDLIWSQTSNKFYFKSIPLTISD